MKHSEAVKHLTAMMVAVQKARSVIKEESDLSDEALAEMFPWIMGDKCPLPTLVKILDSVDGGKKIEPIVYFNLMVALYRFMSPVRFLAGDSLPVELPAPETYLGGWDE